MTRFKTFFLRFWPILVLIAISVLLFLANYVPGTYLLGWDNTLPELNFAVNFEHFFYGVWQEYRGLGTLDGMAHTANMMHWFYSLVLSIFLPVSVIRYLINTLAHLLGGIGMYILLSQDILLKVSSKKSDKNIQLVALFGALLYQFNLMTIQMFYTPLELFSFHFAIIPWGIWSLRRYLQAPSVGNLLLIFLVNLLGVSQAHVPTVFIPYALTLGIILLFELLSNIRQNWKMVLASGFVLITVNAFWGFTYLYSAMHKSAEISASKQNRLGTDETFYRNFAWGDIKSVASFGGFQLDYNDWFLYDEQFDSIMREWVDHYQTSPYQVLSISISSFSVLGGIVLIYLVIKRKQYGFLSLLAIWLFAWSMLGTNIPGSRELTAVLRELIPFFFQIFRFTFTKFSLLYVALMSIMTAIALQFFSEKIPAKQIRFLPSIFTLAMLGFLAYPAFQVYFFYPALRVTVPDSYFKTADKINNSLSEARLATFPIHSLWGWTTGTHTWGYRGSGFFWQMIEQPLVDRSFDPWSKYNETAFLQLNRALYAQDLVAFKNAFEKFHISHILQDSSVFHPGNYQQALFAKETTQVFDSIPEISDVFHNDSLTIWETGATGTSLFLPSSLHKVSSNYVTEYTNADAAYALFDDYYQDDSESGNILPFSFLQKENVDSGQLRIENNFLVLEKSFNSPTVLQAQPYEETQRAIEFSFTVSNSKSGNWLEVLPRFPIFTSESSELPVPLTVPASLSQESVYLAQENKVLLIGPQKTHTYVLDFDVPKSFDLFEYNSFDSEELSTKAVSFTTPVASKQNEKVLANLTILGGFNPEDFSDFCLVLNEDQDCIISHSQLTSELLNTSKQISFGLVLDQGKEYTVPLPKAVLDKSSRISVSYHRYISSFKIDPKQFVDRYNRDLSAFLLEPITNLKIKIPDNSSNLDLYKDTSVDEYNCDSEKSGYVDIIKDSDDLIFKSGKGADLCSSYRLDLDKDLEYLFHLVGETKLGTGIRFYVLNPSTKRFDIDNYSGKGEFDSWYTLSPSQNTFTEQKRADFQLDIRLDAFENQSNKVRVSEAKFVPMPLSWLASLSSLPSEEELFASSFVTTPRRISPVLYTAWVKTESSSGIIVLSQSYDSGWIAFPSWKLWQNYSHMDYNGWANAWRIPEGEHQVIIFYWPQILSLGGYVLLITSGITLLFLCTKNQKRKKPIKNKKIKHLAHKTKSTLAPTK